LKNVTYVYFNFTVYRTVFVQFGVINKVLNVYNSIKFIYRIVIHVQRCIHSNALAVLMN